MSNVCLDIETLATPENSGYAIVVPNYAVVKIPEDLTSDLEWMYVQLPIQEQLDVGLKTDSKTMNFWFNICAQEFPLSLCEMQKSFMLVNPIVTINGKIIDNTNNVPYLLKSFMNDNSSGSNYKSTKVYGNGCNFDCSILQENHRLLFGDANLWIYSSPNNVRTLRLLLSEEEEEQMKNEVQPFLDKFCENIDDTDIMYNLCLHNPLYDAAKEALYTSFMLKLKKST